MPRRLPDNIPFDDAEDEVLFTEAALKADPDAADLAAQAEGWLGVIDAARAHERGARRALAETDAERAVADQRLDAACVGFGDELLLAVKKDREARRWTQFFSVPVSRFVRRALERQVSTVRGWLALAAGQEAVLDTHRAGLERWATAADEAITRTRGTALVRGQAAQARVEMAEALTRERDGLHEALAARARERDLPREWPSVFFRLERRRAAAPAPTPAPEG